MQYSMIMVYGIEIMFDKENYLYYVCKIYLNY